MAVVWQDEQGQDLNKYQLDPVNGEENTYLLTRKATITQVGTPLNKANLDQLAQVDSVAKIIDGRTTVGNAAKLGGVAAGNYPRALTVTGTDLLTWAAAQTTGGFFSANNTVTSGVPATSYWSGLLETFSGSTCRIILTRRVSPYDTYVNIGSGGTWNGWVNVADGGDASKLSGQSTSSQGNEGIPYVRADSVMNIGVYLDFYDSGTYKWRLGKMGTNSALYCYNGIDSARGGYLALTNSQGSRISTQSATPTNPVTNDTWIW